MTPDVYVSKFVETCSHKVQRLTGMTSYRQAFHAAVLVVLVCMAQGMDYFFQGLFNGETSAVTLLMSGFGIISWSLLAAAANSRDNEFWANPKNVFFVEIPAFFKCFILGMGVGLTIGTAYLYVAGIAGSLEFLNVPQGAGFALFLYLMEVPPLPPGQSKVKELLLSLKASLSLAPSEVAS
jgi:hypothetical protein